jgi:hypothetical protein
VHARAWNRQARLGGYWTRRPRPSAASILARFGETVIVGVILLCATGAGPAHAATPGAAPDPSPRPAASSSPTVNASPGPDPAPQAAGSTRPTVNPSRPSVTSLPAPPAAHSHPATSVAPPAGSGAAPSRISATNVAPAAAPPVRPRSSRGSADRGVTRRSGALGQFHLSHARQAIAFVTGASPATRTARRTGALLLLAALALTALVAASSSLLRLIVRMNGGLR